MGQRGDLDLRKLAMASSVLKNFKLKALVADCSAEVSGEQSKAASSVTTTSEVGSKLIEISPVVAAAKYYIAIAYASTIPYFYFIIKVRLLVNIYQISPPRGFGVLGFWGASLRQNV